jgi:16S rRNA (cytosine1402-N4)-methyltransferase
MQMGNNKYSAYDVVNTLEKESLGNIIKVLGDEKDGKLIARKIVNYRKKKLIKTSKELSEIIKEAKRNYGNYKKNPATKTFQAIRIFVNQELTQLILGMIEATKLLANGGILILVSFHSLEDKIIKYFFNLYSNLKKNPSRYLPLEKDKKCLFKILNKKPIQPDEKEISNNIRSRSAKLRYGIRNNNSFSCLEEFKKKFEIFFKIEGIKI